MRQFLHLGDCYALTKYKPKDFNIRYISLMAVALFMCLLAAVEAPAQSGAAAMPDEIRPLQIGDTIPEELWNLPLQVVNHPEGQETITLNDYRGKLIILDFWATWCVPCIKSMYKLDTLQQQLADELMVIPTTYEDADKVAPFFQARGWSLPTATSETTLKNYFPYQSIPHQVWIKDGNVLAVAGHEYANKEYIGKVLRDEPVGFDHKAEVAFDKNKPLFLDGNGGDGSNMLYQSIISGRMQARISGLSMPSDSALLAYNVPAGLLYSTAFRHAGAMLHTTDRYVIYEVDDRLRDRIDQRAARELDLPGRDAWADDNLYCYNLVLPGRLGREGLGRQMLEDLNRFFAVRLGFTASVEMRETEVLALVRQGDFTGVSAGGVSVRSWNNDGSTLTLENQPLDVLLDFLSTALDHRPRRGLEPYLLPLVDQTGISAPVDLTVRGDLADIGDMQRALAPYGLTLAEKTAPVKMIVFKYANY